MSLPLRFEVPNAWVELDLESPAAAAVATRTTLERSSDPVEPEVAAELEARFSALADVMRAAEVQAAFALVPDAPLIGLVGWLAVRVYATDDSDPLGELVAQDVPEGATLVERLVREEETPLGTATIAVHRYSRPATSAVSFGARKSSEPVTERIRWSWRIDRPGAPTGVVTIMTLTDRLRFGPELREHVAAFARGIREG